LTFLIKGLKVTELYEPETLEGGYFRPEATNGRKGPPDAGLVRRAEAREKRRMLTREEGVCRLQRHGYP